MQTDENGATEGATRDATQGANAATPDATQWVSVAQAAQIEGVTVRAIQRRCKGGFYRSRRLETPAGTRLEIDAATLKAGATQGRDTRDLSRDPRRDVGRDDRDPIGATVAQSADATQPAKASAQPDAGATANAELLAHLKQENTFLRGLVEQRDRDAAELRAALREALKAQPRQLVAPSPDPTAQPDPVASQNPAAPVVNVAQPQGKTPQPQAPPKRTPRPLWAVLIGYKPKP